MTELDARTIHVTRSVTETEYDATGNPVVVTTTVCSGGIRTIARQETLYDATGQIVRESQTVTEELCDEHPEPSKPVAEQRRDEEVNRAAYALGREIAHALYGLSFDVKVDPRGVARVVAAEQKRHRRDH